MRGALAAAVARRIAPAHSPERRDLLRRTAIVGSALAVAPIEFSLRPTSAYAAVCRCGPGCPCGSLCCDGYTEFCCALYGENRCPDGTVAGGWWKVDGSQFCGGAARYYLDCHPLCGSCSCGGNGICSGACSGTRCGCGNNRCDHRKAGCTLFRYGQCHQDIRCLGPIVCRLVTCTPPWVLDPACGTSSRTDERTRFHDRPCLNEPFGGVDRMVDAGAAIGLSGWAISPSVRSPAEIHVFVDGRLVARTTANRNRPDVGAVYPAFGPDRGFDLTIPAAPGRRLVCVYAVSPGSGVGKFLAVGEVTVSGLAGSIDLLEDRGGGTLRVAGWLVDPAIPTRPATGRFVVDGAVVSIFTAGDPRPDVAAAIWGVGPDHGFTIDLPVGRGRHQVCLEVVGVHGSVALIGCAEVDLV